MYVVFPVLFLHLSRRRSISFRGLMISSCVAWKERIIESVDRTKVSLFLFVSVPSFPPSREEANERSHKPDEQRTRSRAVSLRARIRAWCAGLYPIAPRRLHHHDERLPLGAVLALHTELVRVDDRREPAVGCEVRGVRKGRRVGVGRVGARVCGSGERLAGGFGGGEVFVRVGEQRVAVHGRGHQCGGGRIDERRRVIDVVGE